MELFRTTEASCPMCKRLTTVRLGDLGEDCMATCPKGHQFVCDSGGRVVAKVRKAEKALDDALKGIGRTIKF